MGQAPNWTPDELLYLEEKWGVLSIKAIAKHLHRSIEGVKIKANRIGLKDNRFAGDGITLNQLAQALNISYSIVKNWHQHHDFPAKPKVLAVRRRVLIVEYHDFWSWAERHQSLVNFARVEPYLLGPEPHWVKAKRTLDTLNFNKRWVRPWSTQDDAQLRNLVEAYRFTYPEIAQALQRTEAAVKRRLYDLGLKARPVRLNNHIRWIPEEVDQLVEMVNHGYGFNTMAERLGKSALGIRGKLERMGYAFRNGRVP
jgi:hypothetical protein